MTTRFMCDWCHKEIIRETDLTIITLDASRHFMTDQHHTLHACRDCYDKKVTVILPNKWKQPEEND